VNSSDRRSYCPRRRDRGKIGEARALLLSLYDEYTIAYRDRRAQDPSAIERFVSPATR